MAIISVVFIVYLLNYRIKKDILTKGRKRNIYRNIIVDETLDVFIRKLESKLLSVRIVVIKMKTIVLETVT